MEMIDKNMTCICSKEEIVPVRGRHCIPRIKEPHHQLFLRPRLCCLSTSALDFRAGRSCVRNYMLVSLMVTLLNA